MAINKKKVLKKMRKRMPGETEVEFNKKGTEIKKVIRPSEE